MTDEEATKAFITRIAECGGDAERQHGLGDQIVEQVLRDHGFPKLADAYYKARKDWWYA